MSAAVGLVVLVVSALVVAAADQATKRAVVRRLGLGQRRRLPLGLELAHVTNPRGGIVAIPTWVAVGIGLLGAAAGVALAVDTTTPAGVVVGFGLVLGGMVGNVWDRIRQGSVVDVLSLWRWRVINLADVALVGGTLVVLVAAVVAS